MICNSLLTTSLLFLNIFDTTTKVLQSITKALSKPRNAAFLYSWMSLIWTTCILTCVLRMWRNSLFSNLRNIFCEYSTRHCIWNNQLMQQLVWSLSDTNQFSCNPFCWVMSTFDSRIISLPGYSQSSCCDEHFRVGLKTTTVVC